jgi:hypothetical protein
MDHEPILDSVKVRAYIEQVGGIDAYQLGELCVAFEDLSSSPPKARRYTHGSEDPIVVEQQSLKCFFDEDEILQWVQYSRSGRVVSRFVAHSQHPSKSVLRPGPRLPLERGRITFADQSRTRNFGRRTDNGCEICCLASGDTLVKERRSRGGAEEAIHQ